LFLPVAALMDALRALERTQNVDRDLQLRRVIEDLSGTDEGPALDVARSSR
jgi:hypothetical protein